MKLYKLLFLIIFITHGTFSMWGEKTAPVPKSELRSAWLPSISTGTSWPGENAGISSDIVQLQKETLIAHIEKMARYNCNALSFQVRPMGDALYKSSCEPWSHYLTGKRGVAPSYDPLEFFVKECHDRGIEAHAWINPFRLKKGATPLTEYDQEHIDKGWTITYGETTIFDPGNPEVRQYIIDRVMEVVTNYDIDGVMFDDYFYCPGLPYKNVTSGYDYEEYLESGTGLSLADWRRENVNSMICETYAAIKDVKPWVRFGLSPRGIGGGPGGIAAAEYDLPACPASAGDGMYNDIFCNPLVWLCEKSIDYISPQIYWPTTQSNAPYKPIASWWTMVSDAFDVPFYPSVGAYRKYNSGEMTLELNINRNENNDGDYGVVFYTSGDMDYYDSELKAALPTKALLPPMREFKTTSPGKIEKLTLDGNVLNCSELNGMRYVFYAVPKSVTLNMASGSVKTGLNAEYILGISYKPSYTLPQDKMGGFWYAVTPYDRYGNEWEMTTLGDSPSKPGPVPVLISPEDGEEFTEGDVVMTVKRIPDALSQYVQVATDSEFSSVLIAVRESSGADDENLMFALPVSYFSDGKYYWRSIASGDGTDEGMSETRSFTIKRNAGGNYTIITDGELYDFTEPKGKKLRLQNLWIRSDVHGNPLGLSQKYCRDFTVVDNVVYVTDMDALKDTAKFRLLRYNAVTGEEMSPLELIPDEDYTGFTAPLNTLTTDDSGNVIIAGLALNNKVQLVVGSVDLNTGKVTTVVSLPVVARIDHIDVVGDFTKDGYVIAASAPTTDVYRWHISDGKVTEAESIPIGVKPGTAPRLQALTPDGAFIDGGLTAFHYYDFNKNKAVGTFTDSKPEQVNGGAYFVFDGMPFLIYPDSNFPAGIVYSIDYGRLLPDSYESLVNLWKFTPKTFGNTSPTGGDFGALAEVHVSQSINPEAYIYVYAANNALAAYKMDYAVPSAVDGVTDGLGLNITRQGDSICFGTEVDRAELFNAAGAMVAAVSKATSLNVAGQSGMFVLKISVNGESKTVKVLL